MPKPAVVMICDIGLERIDAPMMHVTSVARALAQEGHAVDLVARGPDPRIDGVRFHRSAPARPGRLRRIAGVTAVGALTLLRRRRSADSLYIREDWAVVPLMALARALGYRVLAEVNDMRYGPDYQDRAPGLRGAVADRLKRAAAGAAWRCSTLVLPVTPGLKRLIERDFPVAPERVVVVPNGVDGDLVRPGDRAAAQAELGLPGDRRYVAFVGVVAPWVAWDVMLESLALVVRARPDVTLLVVGDIPDREGWDALVARLGLADHVRAVGFVSERARVNRYVAASSVCLSPLRPESRGAIGASPIKVPEYMAAARPVVATGLGGVRELLEESGAGLPVAPGDPAAMAEAIGALLDDPARAAAMGEAGRRAVDERLSWRAGIRRVDALLERQAGRAA